MQQNSAEWLQMRKTKIGASDAPIIMGDSPWTTPLELWERKLDLAPEQAMNPAMRRGHEMEEQLLADYNFMTGLNASPSIAFHEEHDWMMASLDGLAADGSVHVEIKTANADDHQTARRGEVPDKYMAQLQHQLYVVGRDIGHYFSHHLGDNILVEVKRDEEYISRLLKAEQAFLGCLRSFTPPPMTDRDYVPVSDPKTQGLMMELASLQPELKVLQAREAELRKQLKARTDRSCRHQRVFWRKTVTKGAVDYAAIPELNDVDIEHYRKDPVERWTLRIEK